MTVSVLGADADSRRQLESAIGQIQTRVTAIDKTFADERIWQLTSDLDSVNRDIAVTTQALLAMRGGGGAAAGTVDSGENPTRARRPGGWRPRSPRSATSTTSSARRVRPAQRGRTGGFRRADPPGRGEPRGRLRA